MRLLIPSVNYADFLAVTLPAWRVAWPDALVIVATSSDDRATRAVARTHGAHLIVTDAWYRPTDTMNDDTRPVVFNKALAMDEAMGLVGSLNDPPADGEICLSIDADVYPSGPLKLHPKPNTIYGCPRYLCETPEELARQTERLDLDRLQLLAPRMRGQSSYVTLANTIENVMDTARRCLGYFQGFAYRPGLRFGSYRTAGKYDLDFREKFGHRAIVKNFAVLHLGETNRANWRGRVVPSWQVPA